MSSFGHMTAAIAAAGRRHLPNLPLPSSKRLMNNNNMKDNKTNSNLISGKKAPQSSSARENSECDRDSSMPNSNSREGKSYSNDIGKFSSNSPKILSQCIIILKIILRELSNKI
jgi:hypothetical protein